MQIPAGFQLQFARSNFVCRTSATATPADETRAIGASRTVLVSGTRSSQGDAARAVRAALGELSAAEWSGVAQHSGIQDVTALAARAREFGIDGFIAVGGNSASDSVKGAAIVLAEGGPLADDANVLELLEAAW